MNPRIKELAEQAGLQPFEDCGPGYVYKMEKFAELIVKDITTGQRELAKIMSDTGSEDQAYILRITASNIERKYGVEE
jgi:hypothetical protein